jgi:hypothetical protein
MGSVTRRPRCESLIQGIRRYGTSLARVLVESAGRDDGVRCAQIGSRETSHHAGDPALYRDKLFNCQALCGGPT